MEYELAIKLRDAGFPQSGEYWYAEDTYGGPTLISEDAWQDRTYYKKLCVAPTLSELIEACGEDFRSLLKTDAWLATAVKIEGVMSTRIAEKADIPDTAVTKLYLSLHS